MNVRSTDPYDWIHRLHTDELESLEYGSRKLEMIVFLRSCVRTNRREARLHYMPERVESLYELVEDYAHRNRFSEIVHGCHFEHIESILKDGLQCGRICDNSPFRYKRMCPRWSVMDPILNDGNVSVIWFGANINDHSRPESRYGNILFIKQFSDYTASACSKCYNDDLSAPGIAVEGHDGWHFFLTEFYEMRKEVESRFFLSKDAQLPYKLAQLYYPGKPGGPWHLIDKKTGESTALSWLPSLAEQRYKLRHSVAFMIDTAPALGTLHFTLASDHAQVYPGWINCLKADWVSYGSREKACPDDSKFDIIGPRSRAAKEHYRRLCKEATGVFQSFDKSI